MRTSSGTTEKQAYALLCRYGLEHKLPINVEALAKALNIAVKYEPFDDDLSGILVKENGRTAIGVNSSHSITRQRFTIAHELGHFVLKHNGNLFVDKSLGSQAFVVRRDGKSSLGSDILEVQANQFAAALLMPKTLVNAQVEKRLERKSRLSSEDLVSTLARVFVVSAKAMEYRLVNLGSLIPS